jgi:hypothetical protein
MSKGARTGFKGIGSSPAMAGGGMDNGYSSSDEEVKIKSGRNLSGIPKTFPY